MQQQLPIKFPLLKVGGIFNHFLLTFQNVHLFFVRTKTDRDYLASFSNHTKLISFFRFRGFPPRSMCGFPNLKLTITGNVRPRPPGRRPRPRCQPLLQPLRQRKYPSKPVPDLSSDSGQKSQQCQRQRPGRRNQMLRSRSQKSRSSFRANPSRIIRTSRSPSLRTTSQGKSLPPPRRRR